MLDRGVETDTEIDHVIKFAVEQGGVEYAKDLVNDYTNKALGYLDELDESDVKTSLVALVHHSINRDK